MRNLKKFLKTVAKCKEIGYNESKEHKECNMDASPYRSSFFVTTKLLSMRS